MLVVWSKKAELEYAARHPRRKNIRKAGTPVMYDGKPIKAAANSESIFAGYKARGWVKIMQGGDDSIHKVAAKANTEEDRRSRWESLQQLIGSANNYTLKEIAVIMGLSKDTVTKFISKYGADMAKKYGKLPYHKTLARWYGSIMKEPPKTKISNAYEERQIERWRVIIKDIRAMKTEEQIIKDCGYKSAWSVRNFLLGHGLQMMNKVGPLPYSPIMPKYMRKYMA
jgi:hypothetical protein